MKSSNVGLVVGGASKSGTTALYYYLKQHPALCLPNRKELHYFSRQFLERNVAGPGDRYVVNDIPDSFDAYSAFFQHCGPQQIGVDVSPSYLFHYGSAEAIASAFDCPCAVFVLRNPADKAFSQYVHLVSSGREALTFRDALAMEDERFATGFGDIWLYRRSGFYADALEHFIDRLGRDRVKIFYFEDLVDRPMTLLKDICGFVGVDHSFAFRRIAEVNRTGKPRSSLLARVIRPNPFTAALKRILPAAVGREARRLIKSFNTGLKPEYPSDIRTALLQEYRDDILRVEELVGRQSAWLARP